MNKKYFIYAALMFCSLLTFAAIPTQAQSETDDQKYEKLQTERNQNKAEFDDLMGQRNSLQDQITQKDAEAKALPKGIKRDTVTMDKMTLQLKLNDVSKALLKNDKDSERISDEITLYEEEKSDKPFEHASPTYNSKAECSKSCLGLYQDVCKKHSAVNWKCSEPIGHGLFVCSCDYSTTKIPGRNGQPSGR